MLLHHSIPTKIMEVVDITVYTKKSMAEEDAVLNAEDIGELALVVGETVI